MGNTKKEEETKRKGRSKRTGRKPSNYRYDKLNDAQKMKPDVRARKRADRAKREAEAKAEAAANDTATALGGGEEGLGDLDVGGGDDLDLDAADAAGLDLGDTGTTPDAATPEPAAGGEEGPLLDAPAKRDDRDRRTTPKSQRYDVTNVGSGLVDERASKFTASPT